MHIHKNGRFQWLTTRWPIKKTQEGNCKDGKPLLCVDWLPSFLTQFAVTKLHIFVLLCVFSTVQHSYYSIVISTNTHTIWLLSWTTKFEKGTWSFPKFYMQLSDNWIPFFNCIKSHNTVVFQGIHNCDRVSAKVHVFILWFCCGNTLPEYGPGYRQGVQPPILTPIHSWCGNRATYLQSTDARNGIFHIQHAT